MKHEDFKEKIYDYLMAADEMPFEVRNAFEDHFLTCEECWEALETQKVVLGVLEEDADELLTEVEFEDLVDKAKSYEKEGKLEEALKLYKEALELRPDDNEIEKKMAELLKSLPIELFFGDVKQTLHKEKDDNVAPIKNPCEITLHYAGQPDWTYHASADNIFLPQESNLPLHSKKFQPLRFETDNLIIEIHKGRYAGKITIRLKK